MMVNTRLLLLSAISRKEEVDDASTLTLGLPRTGLPITAHECLASWETGAIVHKVVKTKIADTADFSAGSEIFVLTTLICTASDEPATKN